VGMWTSCLGHSTTCNAGAAAAAGRDYNHQVDSPPLPLTAAAAESRLTPLTSIFSVAIGMSAAARVAAHLLCSPWLARLHCRSNSHAYVARLSSD